MLFKTYQLKTLKLPNRIVMAPLTRCRAHSDGTPSDFAALYYQQRARAGLIISEATCISPQAKGYAFTPGIYTNAHIEAWKKITRAVHDAQGRIFCQLWHVGRISHPNLQPHHALPLAPSAIQPNGLAFTEEGFLPFVTPRALETVEIPYIIEQYRHAAVCAKAAGFDGIELHAANGYLLDQFLRSGSNQRTDGYGGSVENRLRLIIEVMDALLTVWPADRIGIRISPVSKIHDMSDENPENTYLKLIEALNPKHLSYIHVIEGSTDEKTRTASDTFDFQKLKNTFQGSYIANLNYNKEQAIEAVYQKQADLISFGRPFIANPNLVEKLQRNLPLREAPKETWYGGGEQGYTDWD